MVDLLCISRLVALMERESCFAGAKTFNRSELSLVEESSGSHITSSGQQQKEKIIMRKLLR